MTPKGKSFFMLAMCGCTWWSMRAFRNSFEKSQKYSGKTPMEDA